MKIDGEVGEGVVEEELDDKPGTTNSTEFDVLQSIPYTFLMRCGFDRWSSGMYTHDPHRASREKELREFLQEA